eukprot:COSAG03_NODE_2_length_28887_cov_60.449825_17_plen_56_part_00
MPGAPRDRDTPGMLMRGQQLSSAGAVRGRVRALSLTDSGRAPLTDSGRAPYSATY